MLKAQTGQTRSKIGRIWTICANEIRRWPSVPKFWVAVVFSILWMHWDIGGIAEFSRTVHVAAAPWGFPFAFTTWHRVMVTVLIEVLLFCDAPFRNESTPYELIRAGRTIWVAGKLLYIWIASLVLAVSLWLLSFMMVLSDIEWTWSWGRVIRTLALSNAGYSFNLEVPYAIIRDYTPVAANLICVALVAMQSALVGTVIFTLNSSRGIPGLGVIGGLMLAFIIGLESPVLGSLPKEVLQYFLPSAWTDLARISLSSSSHYPGYPYILTVLCSLMTVMYIVNFRIYRRREVGAVVTN